MIIKTVNFRVKPMKKTRRNPMKRRSNPSSMKSALQLAKNKGWQLLDAGPTNSPSRGLAPFQIVLSETKGYQPFVTHYLNLEDGGFYSGHYFKTYQEAKKDFIERVNETRLRRNPAKRKIKAVGRQSQATGRAPDKRLLRRRKKTVAGPRGFFANPVHTFKVLTRSKPSAPFALVGSFKDKSRAMQYARAIHKASPTSLSVKVTT